MLRAQQIDVDGLPIGVVEGGPADAATVLFLHGWPECWRMFEPTMHGLADELRVVAIDLPGIGSSEVAPPRNDKRALAAIVHGLVVRMGLRDVTLVGHDVGGMIVFAFLRAHPDVLARAVIMSTVVPGVEPWEDVERNPQIWHFAFHAVPELPELLVAGHEARYFDFFFDRLAGPTGVPPEARARHVHAYERPDALRTGFEWYRAFAQDVTDNRTTQDAITTPTIYVRGTAEPGELATYLAGFRDAGLAHVEGMHIPDAGHFAFDERPAETLAVLRDILDLPRR